MLDMTMGSGVAIASVCLAVPATVKIIVSARAPKVKEDGTTNTVLLELIKSMKGTMESRAEIDKETTKNLIEMNIKAKSTHEKVNDIHLISKMTEDNTKKLTVSADSIKGIVGEIRVTQQSIERRIK